MDPLGSQSDPYWKRIEEIPNPYEEEFNNGVREITILCIIGMILYAISYAFMNYWRQNNLDDEVLNLSEKNYINKRLINLPGSNNNDDIVVYRISFALCTFSLAVSIGAALLLPISTISNEILHKYPTSWYIKWLNTSLIHGIWNLIFVLSNLSLFVFLPFAFLFCESEGLPFFGNKRGLMARAKETLITLLLLSITILGMMYVLAAVISRDMEPLLNIYNYLPFLYSVVSFVGVLMLLIGTPLGFARLFTIVGDLVIKPTFTKNLDEDHAVAQLEETCLRERVRELSNAQSKPNHRMPNSICYNRNEKELLVHYQQLLSEQINKRKSLEKSKRSPKWQRFLGFPLVMLSLLFLTLISLLRVILNMAQIIAGFRSLPVYQETVDLGLSSLSTMGVIGVIIEVTLIGYLLVTSLIGLYNIPIIKKIQPVAHETSLTHLIFNCALFVILSSALPLLSKVLGITNFDLLGSFGEVKWLGNIYIVLLYNTIFAVAASIYLFNKFTTRVREEIWRRIQLYFSTIFKRNLDKTQNLGVATTPVSTTPNTGLKIE